MNNVIKDKVLRSALASKLAYAKPQTQSKFAAYSTQLRGKTHDEKPWSIDNPRSGVHAYVWQNGPKSLLIAFKGSSTLLDICNFCDVRLKDFHFTYSSVRIHSGVLRLFHSIEPALTEQIIERRKKYITFCGHSLGGAIATLAAVYYANLSNNNIDIACHTFGAPKVGDHSFNEWVATSNISENINIATYGDLVPRLPLGFPFSTKTSLLIGGHHSNPFKEHDLDTYIEYLRNDLALQSRPK